MTMRRYDSPFGTLSLREAMYRLLEESFTQSAGTRAAGEYVMPLDLYETTDALVACVVLPGVLPEDIDVTITGDTLTVRGEVHEQQVEPGARYHLREQRYGPFSRSVTLPVPVEAEQVHAECDNGILMLTMPKQEQTKPRTIKINTRSAVPVSIEAGDAHG